MVWVIVALGGCISSWAQYFGQAQGGTLGVSAWGAEALGSNPAGILQGVGRWEVVLPAFGAEMYGLTLRQYSFYFGGVQTPSGRQRRRLGKEEWVQFVSTFEEQPVSFHGRSEVLGILWRPAPEHALGLAVGTQLWCRWQLPRGSTEVAQQNILGADTIELRGGLSALRLYSVATAAYARRIWRTVLVADTASPWHEGVLTGGIAVHLYRGHAYVEQASENWLYLVPFVPTLWDSTVSWALQGLQDWHLSRVPASWLATLTGFAPSTGWGAGLSVGMRWSWYRHDSVEAAAIGLSLEQLGVLRWKVTELHVAIEADTVTGLLGSAAVRLSSRYTPARQAIVVTEWMPVHLRIGGAVALSAFVEGVPIWLSGELSYRAKRSWSSQGFSWGSGLLWSSPRPWLPWVGLGGIWSQQTKPRVTAGLRWILPLEGFQTAVELTTTSLLGWIFRQRVSSSALGIRLWVRF